MMRDAQKPPAPLSEWRGGCEVNQTLILPSDLLIRASVSLKKRRDPKLFRATPTLSPTQTAAIRRKAVRQNATGATGSDHKGW